MARKPAPLPESLRGRAFGVADAADVPPKRLRATDLWSPAYGVRLPTGMEDMRSQLRARLCRQPDGVVFSHATAALLWKLPLPIRFLWRDAVYITSPKGVRARRGKNVTGFQRELTEAEHTILGGIPATSLLRTFCDLADILTIPELVVVGDAIVSPKGKGVAMADLATAIERRPRRRSELRAAFAQLDRGAESPKESELRLLLRDRAVTGLVTQFTVRDAHGAFVARVDLAIPGLKLAIEYEGDHHRDRGQWRKDHQRRRRLEALGWVYIHVTQADLDDPTELLDDVRTAIRRQAARGLPDRAPEYAVVRGARA